MKSITIKDKNGKLLIQIKKCKDGSYDQTIMEGLDVKVVVIADDNGKVMFGTINERHK